MRREETMTDRRPAPENADSGFPSTLSRVVPISFADVLRVLGCRLPDEDSRDRPDDQVVDRTARVERTPRWLHPAEPGPDVAELSDRDGVRRSVPGEPTSVRWFSLVRLLTDRRRRLVLYYLAEHDSRPVKLEELARHVAARERGVPVEDLAAHAYEDTFVELARTHLPLLATTGVVEFERIGLMVGLADVPRSLAVVLRAAAQFERREGDDRPFL